MTAAHIVSEPSSLQALCARVRQSPRVGLDTEFHAERSYAPRLMVVQIAFDDGVAIVDPLALEDLRPLAEAMREPAVIGHALSSDLKIFADRYSVLPQRVYDTQVEAAFAGYGMQVSLADLVRDLRGVRLAKSQTVSDWSSRPFSPRQIDYLVDDVAHLLPMQDALRERLEAKGRYGWALEQCAELSDPARYRFDDRRAYLRLPGAARMSRRELGILNELVKLRDRIARERDLPVKYVIPDDVVAGLASLKPKRVEELAQLRRFDAGARRQLGDAILHAIARGEALAESELPEKPQRPLGPSRDSLAAVLSVAAGEIARDAGLPSTLLVPRSALERVAREAPRTQEAFATALGLRPWQLALVGEPLWRLLSGRDAIAIEGYADGDPKLRFTHESASQ